MKISETESCTSVVVEAGFRAASPRREGSPQRSAGAGGIRPQHEYAEVRADFPLIKDLNGDKNYGKL